MVSSRRVSATGVGQEGLQSPQAMFSGWQPLQVSAPIRLGQQINEIHEFIAFGVNSCIRLLFTIPRVSRIGCVFLYVCRPTAMKWMSSGGCERVD
jgi:hypothetical protein